MACVKAALRTDSRDAATFLRVQRREQNESPDVETPGLLVKALISSFFISKALIAPDFSRADVTNIAVKKHTNK